MTTPSIARAFVIPAIICGVALSVAVAASTIPVPPRAHPLSAGSHSTARQRPAQSGPLTAYGGGAALPAAAFVGISQATTANPETSPDSGSIFGYFETVNSSTFAGFQYCQNSASFGKKVYEGTVAASGTCASLGLSPVGFGIPASVQPAADFVALDYLGGKDYSTYLTDAGTSGNPIFGRGEPVQIPYIFGSVALFFNNSDVASSESVSLSSSTLCQIADGQITDWDQVPVNPAQPAGAKFPEKPLLFVYRSDSSGTTTAFSNHLSVAKVCTGTGQTFGLNNVYDPGNTVVSPAPAFGALPSPLPAGASNANFLGANGNSDLITCILGTAPACTSPGSTTLVTGGDGAIGYVESAYALAFVSPPSVNFADLYVVKKKVGTNYSPIKDLPVAVRTVRGAFATDLVLNSFVANGRPNPVLTAPPVAPPTAGCMLATNPNGYDNPSAGYPIVAIASLAFSSAGNGSKATGLQKLAKFAQSSANYGPGRITDVDRYTAEFGSTGYSQPNFTTKTIAKAADCIGT